MLPLPILLTLLIKNLLLIQNILLRRILPNLSKSFQIFANPSTSFEIFQILIIIIILVKKRNGYNSSSLRPFGTFMCSNEAHGLPPAF